MEIVTSAKSNLYQEGRNIKLSQQIHDTRWQKKIFAKGMK